MAEDFLSQLRRVNGARWAAWAEGAGPDPLYMSNEFGGEAGEVQNVVKKLVREDRGWRGSRSSVDALGEEIADSIVCLDSLARNYGLNLAAITAAKFNKTSAANGFPHVLTLPSVETGQSKPLCTMCDDTGYKDHAWLRTEPCDHQRPAPAGDVEAVARVLDAYAWSNEGMYIRRQISLDKARAVIAAMNPKPAEAASDPCRLPSAADLATADKLARRMGGRFVPHDATPATEKAVETRAWKPIEQKIREARAYHHATVGVDSHTPDGFKAAYMAGYFEGRRDPFYAHPPAADVAKMPFIEKLADLGITNWRDACEWLIELDEIHVGDGETDIIEGCSAIRQALAALPEGGA